MRRNKLLIACKKRLPTICLVVSAISGAAALYFTGRATVKAVRKYDELKENGVEITPKVIAKNIVPYYIPALGFASTSLALNITGNTIHANRNRVLSLAAASAVETLKDFKEKSLEVIGEEKVKEIETEQAKDAKIISGKVDFDDRIRVYDVSNRVKIETTYKKLYEAESEVNLQLSDSSWSKQRVSLGDFYRYLGLEEKKVRDLVRSNMIWDSCYMIENFETNWVSFSHEEVYDKDGTLMVMLRYFIEPEFEHVIDASYEN